METTLNRMKNGEQAVIKYLHGGQGFCRKMEHLNIRIGKRVKKIVSQPLNGPVIIQIDGRQIAIGRGMASRIYLEEIR